MRCIGEPPIREYLSRKHHLRSIIIKLYVTGCSNLPQSEVKSAHTGPLSKNDALSKSLTKAQPPKI